MHTVYYENSTMNSKSLEIFYSYRTSKDYCVCILTMYISHIIKMAGVLMYIIYTGSSPNQVVRSHEYSYVAKQLKGTLTDVRAKFS